MINSLNRIKSRATHLFYSSSRMLQEIQTTILLALIFMILVIPIGLIRKLRTKPVSGTSYFVESDRSRDLAQSMTDPF